MSVISTDNQVITELLAVATAVPSLSLDRHLMGRTPIETVKVFYG